MTGPDTPEPEVEPPEGERPEQTDNSPRPEDGEQLPQLEG